MSEHLHITPAPFPAPSVKGVFNDGVGWGESGVHLDGDEDDGEKGGDESD